MKTLITVLFLSLTIISTAGNTNKDKLNDKTTAEKSVLINGKIIDSVSKESLAGVKISVANANIVVFTDFDGNFNIELPTNEIGNEIRVSYISYEETTVRIVNENDKLIEISQVY